MTLGVYFVRSAHALLVSAALLSACALQQADPGGGSGSDDLGSDLPADLLDAHSEFVAVGKANAQELADQIEIMGRPPGDVAHGQDDFLLAIRRDLLGQRWFLSAYVKQFHLANAAFGAAMTLGTRVVSFREQNGKLFIFDAS